MLVYVMFIEFGKTNPVLHVNTYSYFFSYMCLLLYPSLLALKSSIVNAGSPKLQCRVVTKLEQIAENKAFYTY